MKKDFILRKIDEIDSILFEIEADDKDDSFFAKISTIYKKLDAIKKEVEGGKNEKL